MLSKFDEIYDSIIDIVNNDVDVESKLIDIINENGYSCMGTIRTILIAIKPVLNRYKNVEPYYNDLAKILRSRSKSGKI